VSQQPDDSANWVDFDDEPIMFVNAFLVQHQPEEFVLSFGQLTGAPVVGTPEQVREAAGSETVPILPVARIGLTRHRVTELIGVLQATLEDHDRVTGR
jgi:hypothetical protein